VSFIQVGVYSLNRYQRGNRRSDPVPQFTPTMQSARQSRAVAASDDQHALMRGVVNAIILSMTVWIAVGYLTFALR
jgi:hypothetical protein